METNKILEGDALEILKTLPNYSVDLVIIDPPYEMDGSGGGGAFGSKQRKYHRDMEEYDLKSGFNNEVLLELMRIMKKINMYIFCNKNQIPQISNFFKELNVDLLIFHKKNPVPMVNNKYLSDLEYVFFIREKGVKLYGTYSSLSKMYSANIVKNDYEHPTVKPVKLIEKFILNSSKENDIVLDCYMGSGTTAVASKKHFRRYIGIEIDPNWVQLAEQRIKQCIPERKLHQY